MLTMINIYSNIRSWAVGTVVAHLVYIQRVGGSKPSPPTTTFTGKTKMKKLALIATLLAFTAGSALAAPSAVPTPEPRPTRQVCKMVDGKQQCKTYKVHKKKPAAKKAPAKKAPAKKKAQ